MADLPSLMLPNVDFDADERGVFFIVEMNGKRFRFTWKLNDFQRLSLHLTCKGRRAEEQREAERLKETLQEDFEKSFGAETKEVKVSLSLIEGGLEEDVDLPNAFREKLLESLSVG